MVTGLCTCNSVYSRAPILCPRLGHHLFIHCHTEKVVGNISDPCPKCRPQALSTLFLLFPFQEPQAALVQRRAKRRGRQRGSGGGGPSARPLPAEPGVSEKPRRGEMPLSSSIPIPIPGRGTRSCPPGRPAVGDLCLSSASAVRGWSHRTREGKHRPEAPRSAAEGEGREGPEARGSGCWRARGGDSVERRRSPREDSRQEKSGEQPAPARRGRGLLRESPRL